MKNFYVFLLLIFAFSLRGEIKLNGEFDWQNENVKSLGNKILYYSMELNEPRIIKLSVVRIDLRNPKLRFKITGKSEKWGEPMEELPQFTINTERKRSRTFMEEAFKNGENMVVAVNGSPWTPWQKPWNHRYAQVSGLLVADGELVAYPSKNHPSFIIRKDGTCDFIIADKNSDLSAIQYAISGFGFVLHNNKFTVADNIKQLAPRTGYGLSENREYLYLLAIDGRQEGYSMGSSVYEVGELLKYFGASDALNMDGGGSTTLLIRENGKIKKLNHHKNDAERTVAATLGIIIAE